MFHALPKLAHPMLAPRLAGEFDHFGERHQVAPIQAVADGAGAKVKCRIEIIGTVFVIRENVKWPDFGISLLNESQPQPSAGQARDIFQKHPRPPRRFTTFQPPAQHRADGSQVERQCLTSRVWQVLAALV